MNEWSLYEVYYWFTEIYPDELLTIQKWQKSLQFLASPSKQLILSKQLMIKKKFWKETNIKNQI